MPANKFLLPIWIIALSLAILAGVSVGKMVMGASAKHSESAQAIDMLPTEVAQNSLPNLPVTSIAFAEQFHDFGVIPDDKKDYTDFVFTNTGKEPLIILGAEGSCGCTVPTWPKEPIAPGKSSKIEVAFDPTGKTGEHSKIVTITSNTEPATTIITIKATIVKYR